MENYMKFLKNLLEKFMKDSKFRLLTLVVLSLLILFIFLLLVGFSLWFWICLVLFAGFFFGYIKYFAKFALMIWLIIFVVILVLSIVTMSSTKSAQMKKSAYSSAKALTPEECKPYYDKYNNTVHKISGDNLIGSIGTRIDPADCKQSLRYIITFNASLPVNPHADLIAGATPYNYVMNLHRKSETARGHYGVGVLSIVRQNAMTLPDPFADSIQIAEHYRNPADTTSGPTGSFYWSYEVTGYFSEKYYQERLEDVVFEVVDGLPYVVKEPMDIGGFTYSIDHEKAEKEGRIVKTFELSVSN